MNRKYNGIKIYICAVIGSLFLMPVVHAAPSISNIRFDGMVFVSGDPIAASPRFMVQATGVSIDASSFVLYLDGVHVSTLSPQNFTYNNNDFSYSVSTRLQPGEHLFVLSVRDNNDGIYATCNVTADVHSRDTDVIGDPLAIPNPATHNMRITYKLTQPGDIYISIYNLNAEKVWERELSRGMAGTNAGYNEVLWDLKSGYDDYCPNGVYLCVISKKDTETNRTVMGKIKLFILR